MSAPLPVIITPNAAEDLTASWHWLRDRNPRAANEWLTGIRGMILELGTMPEAHPVAPESQSLDLPIRGALYGRGTRWRIYYAVIDQSVQVLHVRHGRRSDWQP
jgi:plasmid stabilization system protein ParE